MASNRLLLNQDKTEFLWLATRKRLHLVDNSPFDLDGVIVEPVTKVRLLRVCLDASLSLVDHINKLVKNTMYQLRQLKSIRRLISVTTASNLVRALVVSRIDCCNSIMYGLPLHQLNRLQSVLNVGARLVFHARRHDHLTPLLKERLHWLRVPQRILFKQCVFVYKALNDPFAPEYLSRLIIKTSVEGARHFAPPNRYKYWSLRQRRLPSLETNHSPGAAPQTGTLFRTMLGTPAP